MRVKEVNEYRTEIRFCIVERDVKSGVAKQRQFIIGLAYFSEITTILG